MRLIFLFLLLPFIGMAQNDTTKYYKSLDYGWSYQRLKARAALVLPSDTVTNKLGIVTIDTTLFVGNGLRWVKVGGTTSGGGGGTADSSIFYTKFRSDTSRSNIYSNINTKLNKSDSTIYQTKFRSDTSRSNIYSAIGNKLNTSDSSIFYTKFRSDTSRSNIYSAIGNKLNTSDTSNAFLISVSQPNDSSLTFVKGTTSTNYIIRSSIAGSATRMITQVYNKSGATITKGSVVYINGAHSSILPSIALAKANTEETSAYTYGLVENDIPNNTQGVVIQSGSITNLNLPTSSYTDGQTLYLSPTVAGGYTTTKPLAPYHYVAIGTIVRAHPNFGTIIIAVRNGFQLDEMSDVSIALVPNDSTLLQFSRVDSLWHDVSVTNAIGNRYIKPSDTSVFQRKSIDAYSFQANNTASVSNSTANYYRDVASQTLSGGITWTGTAPSGTANHQYRWNRVGNLVTLYITLVYGTAGANNTQVTITLPSDLPTPFSPTGLTAGNDVLYMGNATITTSTNTTITTARTCMLRRNTANNGYEIIATTVTGAQKFVSITLQYFTN
jgi:hypothetical protein